MVFDDLVMKIMMIVDFEIGDRFDVDEMVD